MSRAFQQWCALNGRRRQWAYDACDTFVQGLDAKVRERLVQSRHVDEARVVVFGKTQVGKTTLLLDLMGVLPEHLPGISRVLRGRRAVGHSATATTMEYCRSPDQRWSLEMNGQRRSFDTDEAMEQALAELRVAMESGGLQLQEGSWCTLQIPLDRFALDPQQVTARMLDLPGDRPANPTEQAHVSLMARTHVPHADLILLVGGADDLTFLHRGGVSLPGIEDWQLVPDRFRIITTYSFQPQSVRRLVWEQPGELDPAVFRERLLQQIEISCPLHPRARQLERFYPLEFGDSWRAQQDNDAQQPDVRRRLHARVNPMLLQLRADLVADIRASAQPLARIMAAVQVHDLVARVKEDALLALDQAADELRKALADSEQALARATSNHTVHEARLQQLQRQLDALALDSLNQDLGEDMLALDTDRPEWRKALEAPARSVGSFRATVHDLKGLITVRFRNAKPRHGCAAAASARSRFWASLAVTLDGAALAKTLDDAFAPLHTQLDGYWMDAYLRDTSYVQDCALLKRCRDDALCKAADLLRAAWLQAAHAELTRLRSKHRMLHGALLASSKDIQTYGSECARQTAELARQQLERDEQHARWDAQLEQSKRFRGLLAGAYAQELSSRRSTWRTHSQPGQRLLAILGALRVQDTWKELMHATGTSQQEEKVSSE